MTFAQNTKLSTIVVFMSLALAQSASAASFIDKSKTVTCKNGSSSSSQISLAKAICGCVNKGGAVGHSTKNCAKKKK